MPSPPRICAVHQPNVFPRLSTLAKLYAADVWVVLDDVQFARRDYQHRARLGTPGEPSTQQWLSVPVHLSRGRSTQIKDVRLVTTTKSRRRVSQLVKQHYGRRAHWRAVAQVVDDAALLMRQSETLAAVATFSALCLLRELGWEGEVLSSREVATSPERSTRLAELTRAVGATAYLSGTGGSRYLDAAVFGQRSLTVHVFRPPPSAHSLVWKDAALLSALATLSIHGRQVMSSELKREADLVRGLVGDR